MIDKILIAPCGMNCGICSRYLAEKNKTPNVLHCKGCRIVNRQCAHIKKSCIGNKILSGEVNFCYECEDFPCRRLKVLDKRYRNNYGMSMIENLKEIKKSGMNHFLKNQYKKYKCPTCTGLISVHNKKCFNCETIKSWNS